MGEKRNVYHGVGRGCKCEVIRSGIKPIQFVNQISIACNIQHDSYTGLFDIKPFPVCQCSSFFAALVSRQHF